jgi:hypothetical protein
MQRRRLVGLVAMARWRARCQTSVRPVHRTWTRTLISGVTLLAGLALLSSMAIASGTPFNVTSSLDGKSVLPHRIHWLAFPALPMAQVKAVDFVIDGKVDWIEHARPYTYADDGGYLVTSWLSPGLHRFTVRAIADDGRTASDTVVARVAPPPAVPPALAGTWQRTVNTADAPAPGSPGNPTDTYTPDGTYTMTFDRKWIFDSFPGKFSVEVSENEKTGDGFQFVDDWTPGASSFYVQGAVTFRVPNNSQRLAGWWCETWGPSATYTWSVTGDTLTMAPVGGPDACAIRGFIWTGRWTRVG